MLGLQLFLRRAMFAAKRHQLALVYVQLKGIMFVSFPLVLVLILLRRGALVVVMLVVVLCIKVRLRVFPWRRSARFCIEGPSGSPPAPDKHRGRRPPPKQVFVVEVVRRSEDTGGGHLALADAPATIAVLPLLNELQPPVDGRVLVAAVFRAVGLLLFVLVLLLLVLLCLVLQLEEELLLLLVQVIAQTSAASAPRAQVLAFFVGGGACALALAEPVGPCLRLAEHEALVQLVVVHLGGVVRNGLFALLLVRVLLLLGPLLHRPPAGCFALFGVEQELLHVVQPQEVVLDRLRLTAFPPFAYCSLHALLLLLLLLLLRRRRSRPIVRPNLPAIEPPLLPLLRVVPRRRRFARGASVRELQQPVPLGEALHRPAHAALQVLQQRGVLQLHLLPYLLDVEALHVQRARKRAVTHGAGMGLALLLPGRCGAGEPPERDRQRGARLPRQLRRRPDVLANVALQQLRQLGRLAHGRHRSTSCCCCCCC
eukprot:scaffold498_cov291-Prasinococcus_capsulatus_cf.AAC.1